MAKALTLPSGADSITVYTSDGTSEVMLLNKEVGGGASGPFSKVFYVDKSTSVAPADQDGSDEAPFSTILAGLDAMQAAQPNVDGTALIVLPGDYSGESSGGALLAHHISIVGAIQGDSVFVQTPALSWNVGALITLGNLDCTRGILDLGGGASVFATFCQIDQVINGGSLFIVEGTLLTSFSGDQFVARHASIGADFITINGNTPIELEDTELNSLISGASMQFSWGAPGGFLILDSRTAFSFHALTPAADLGSNGQPLVKADQGGAILTVAVPALAAGVLAYVNVVTTGTELEGIDTNDVVVGNPRSDLSPAGANDGYFIGCRVSAADTIRCAFVGQLAGGNTSMMFGRITRIVPPPA